MKYKNKIRPYAKILKNDCDFDWCYVIPLLRKKFERMASYFEKSQLVEGWEQTVREIRLCIKLMNIVFSETNLYDLDLKVNTRNSKRFLPYDTIYNKYDLVELYEEKAWHLLWKIIDYKMRNWWD